MAREWDVSFRRMADAVELARQNIRQEGLPPPPPFVPSAPPPVNPGPRPPLTMYPQVGPAEQMMDRALRERGLSPEVFALSRKIPTRVVPIEDMGGAGGDYTAGTNAIRVGYRNDISGEGTRSIYAHELRHAHQGNTTDPTQVSMYDKPVNQQFLADAQRWATTPEDYSDYVASQMELQAKRSDIYSGVSAHETDAYISMNPAITADQMPAYMQPYYAGWWNPGAQPDTQDQRGGGWSVPGKTVVFEDGSIGREPIPRGDYSPRPAPYGPRNAPYPKRVTWLDDSLDRWRLQGGGPDVKGNWG